MSPSDSAPRRDKPLILVADDDLVIRRTMCAVLRESGYAIEEAADGLAAYEQASAHRPDLIILDLFIPRLDGYEFCRRLRTDAQLDETPVLVLTGLEDTPAIRQAFEIGATDFATKPLSAPLLSHRVRFMLRSVEMMRELKHSEARLAE